MINRILISNYAIIDHLEVDFNKGFTTITGETGAGKSIIIGALYLLLGNRFDTINFKNKSTKSIVEAIFDISSLNIKDFFCHNDIDYQSNLIIRREFLFEGKSRSFINDTPVKLNILKKLSIFLVDVHSQHENLLINNENFQINLLDSFCSHQFSKFIDYRKDYTIIFQKLDTLKNNLISKQKDFNESNYNIDFYKNIINEFDDLNLEKNQKEDLELEYKKITNLHKIKIVLLQVLSLLENSDASILSNLNLVKSKLSDVSDYDLMLKKLLARLNQNLIDINDIVMDLHTVNHDLNSDKNKLEYIEDKLNSINSLESKLNVYSSEELIKKVDSIRLKVQSFDNFSKEVFQIKLEITECENKLSEIAKNLTFFRKKASINLVNSIKEDLFNLGIQSADLLFSFTEMEYFSTNGLDQVRLMFSANKGFELKPISEIASGGEIARLMLCIKKHLFQLNSFSVIVFDEIDSGVSGDVGRKMGKIIKDMSINGQVICITHLPQIASLGHLHYQVLKHDQSDVTSVQINKLNNLERINELARMLSGDEVNDEAIANAKKMLDI